MRPGPRKSCYTISRSDLRFMCFLLFKTGLSLRFVTLPDEVSYSSEAVIRSLLTDSHVLEHSLFRIDVQLLYGFSLSVKCPTPGVACRYGKKIMKKVKSLCKNAVSICAELNTCDRQQKQVFFHCLADTEEKLLGEHSCGSPTAPSALWPRFFVSPG